MSYNVTDISFTYEVADFKIENEPLVRQWIEHLLINRYKISNYILNFIFVSIEQIIELNKTYINHEYETDVISFDFSEDFNVFGGDIFICPEVVKTNAEEYKENFEVELKRVMIHGVLHFIGYNDIDELTIDEMRKQENICLSLYLK